MDIRPFHFFSVPANFFEYQYNGLFHPLAMSFTPYMFHNANWSCGKEQDNCLDYFLKKTGRDMQYYVDALAILKHDDIKFYVDTYGHYDLPGSAHEAMVVDGFYLLEVMSVAIFTVSGWSNAAGVHFTPDKISNYKHDILLVENQFPLKVLEILCPLIYPEKESAEPGFLKRLICGFLSIPEVTDLKWSQCLHILDVYRASFLPDGLILRMKNGHITIDINKPEYHFYIPSATELHQAKIGIKKNSENRTAGIEFSNKTLWLPNIRLRQRDLELIEKSALYNVIMLERVDPDVTKHFCSYIFFMNRLLNGRGDDVRLLQSRGIINPMVDDEVVKNFYNDLYKIVNHSATGVVIDTRVFGAGKYLIERYNRNTEPWRQDLFQNYLRSYVGIISAIAAFLLFSLTTIQTVYTVLSYYNS